MPDQSQSTRKRPLRAIIAGVVALVISGVVFADYWMAEPLSRQSSFVGRDACAQCHQTELAAFTGSHHDLAMDVATDETVLGDFDDVIFEHDGLKNRLFRDGKRFMVNTEGENGEMQDFEVKYVFGVTPLQQYMVEFDRTDDMPANEVSRLQVLRITWNTEAKRWYYLRPTDVPEKLEPDDPLHWTGIGQRWQNMCADCHSTNLKRNFDTNTGRYHTTFSEIDVSCESCHGPGSLHIELANQRSLFWDRNHGYALARLKGDDAEPQLQTCAPCHSRRGVIDATFKPGPNFHNHFALELLRRETYHDDGQIMDEDYVYGSFIQSKMYHKGIRCTDCHDPHSLQLKKQGNETCTSCHQHAAGKYDVPSHHHHAPGTAGAMCVNCHMPHTTYMGVDKRRDHSLRVPRPDLSVKIGTPNACSSCHVSDQLKMLDDKTKSELETKEYALWLQAAKQGNESAQAAIKATDQWCDDACEKWYGAERKKPPHFAEPLAAFRNGDRKAAADLLQLLAKQNELVPEIAKATVLSELTEAGVRESLPAAKAIVEDPHQNPMVRAAATNAFMLSGPITAKKWLMPLLKDDVRLVRTEAARVLLASGAFQAMDASERTQVELALREVKAAILSAPERGNGHMVWGSFCEQMGRVDEAIESYETALRVEPGIAVLRTNLAALLERSAASAPPAEAERLRARVKQLRAEEMDVLARDLKLDPNNGFIHYRYGLSLYINGKPEQALIHLKRAAELQPNVPEHQQALRAFQEQFKQ